MSNSTTKSKNLVGRTLIWPNGSMRKVVKIDGKKIFAVTIGIDGASPRMFYVKSLVRNKIKVIDNHAGISCKDAAIRTYIETNELFAEQDCARLLNVSAELHDIICDPSNSFESLSQKYGLPEQEFRDYLTRRGYSTHRQQADDGLTDDEKFYVMRHFSRRSRDYIIEKVGKPISVSKYMAYLEGRKNAVS